MDSNSNIFNIKLDSDFQKFKRVKLELTLGIESTQNTEISGACSSFLILGRQDPFLIFRIDVKSFLKKNNGFESQTYYDMQSRFAKGTKQGCSIPIFILRYTCHYFR